MPENPEIVKVTVTIETSKTITTVNIPRSSIPEWESVFDEPEFDWTGTKFTRPPDLIGLEMSLKLFKDPAGVTHTIVVQNKEIDGDAIADYNERSKQIWES